MKNKKIQEQTGPINEKKIGIIERRDKECFRLKPNKSEPLNKENLKTNDPKLKKREL